MRLRRSLFLSFAALALPVTLTRAQEPRIEQARQIDALSPGTAPSLRALDSGSFERTAGRDGESFGIQQILKDEVRLRPFRAFADISAFVTNNVALTPKAPLSDSFLVATFGFEYRRPLPGGIQFESTLRVAGFRYNEYRVLDFNSVDAGGGLSYHAEKLGGIDLFVRYNFNQLLSAETDDTFFTNHTITAGVQKALPFSQAHYAFFGVTGQVGFADPKPAGRSEFAAYAGYHLQATRNFEVDLLYRYAYLIYPETDRADHNQTVSLGFRYRFTDWLSVSATTYAAWNRSDRDAFDYDVANGGGAITLSLQF